MIVFILCCDLLQQVDLFGGISCPICEYILEIVILYIFQYAIRTHQKVVARLNIPSMIHIGFITVLRMGL